MLTHGNVTWNVVNLLSCADFRGDDVTIALAPFFRVGGTGVNVLPVLFMGGTVVVPGDVHPDDILRLTEEHHITVGFGTPDILESLIRSQLWPTADLSGVRFLITGGAPVPEALIRTYLERGLTLLQGYGLSEAAPVALLLEPESALSKVGSAGTPPLLVDTKIVGPDGTDVGSGQAGELCGPWPERHGRVLGPARGDGRGADCRTDGFGQEMRRAPTRTGTSGSSAGWLTASSPTGRSVHPGDVERILLSHPAVADAGVAASPRHPAKNKWRQPSLSWQPGAETTERELLAWCREHLAAYQVPAFVTFTDRLPRNSVGKLIRAELQNDASATVRRAV